MAGDIKIKQMDLNGNVVKIWNSMSEAAKSFGCKGTYCIGRVYRHERGRRTYKGFMWEYLDVPQVKTNADIISLMQSRFSEKELHDLYLKLKSYFNDKS